MPIMTNKHILWLKLSKGYHSPCSLASLPFYLTMQQDKGANVLPLSFLEGTYKRDENRPPEFFLKTLQED